MRPQKAPAINATMDQIAESPKNHAVHGIRLSGLRPIRFLRRALAWGVQRDAIFSAAMRANALSG
jgi:hypothetical protein